MFRRFRTNAANQSNKIKGGINISNATSNNSFEELVIEGLKVIKNDIDNIRKEIAINTDNIHKLKQGLNIYVQNNGVKPEIKKIVSDILEK